jgi:cbb3-type cytochrome oxidase subunit 3
MQLFGRRWFVALATVAIVAAARSAHACAMCGLPLGDVKTHAYNTSVLFMMTVPYSIFLIGVVVAFFAYRTSRKRQLDIEDSHRVPGPVPPR